MISYRFKHVNRMKNNESQVNWFNKDKKVTCVASYHKEIGFLFFFIHIGLA